MSLAQYNSQLLMLLLFFHLLSFIICKIQILMEQIQGVIVKTAEKNPYEALQSEHGKTFPGGASDTEPACQCRTQKRCRFNPWVGKIP